jgi:hypothetical protein
MLSDGGVDTERKTSSVDAPDFEYDEDYSSLVANQGTCAASSVFHTGAIIHICFVLNRSARLSNRRYLAIGV